MLFQATPPPDEAARRAEEQALLKQDLMEVSAQLNTEITQESFLTDFAESEKESQQLEAQLNSPVAPNKQVPAESCYIGSWLGNNFLDGYTEKDFPKIQKKVSPGRYNNQSRYTRKTIYAKHHLQNGR